jgi:hypothetical protein
MSGLFDQIVNYSPPLLTAGQVNYKGTWNAATNTPGLVNPPDALSKGDYYVVSAAGTQFGLSFAVGDWIISNGTAWEKVDLTDAVSSVFGRTGAVVGVSTDYSAVGITNTAIGAANPSTGAFTSLSSSSTTTLNGTTVPASKTLVVTTDKLSALAATTSAELAGVISDETGSGALVFANSPTLVTPALGTPSALVGTNITGTAAAFNVNGTVGATTPSTGAFTSVTALSNSGYQAVVGQLTSGDRVGISGQASGSGAALVFFDNAQTTFRPAVFDASSHSLKISGVEKASVTSTGLQGAIGVTTPAAGSFTTLGSSSTTTLNGTTIPASSTLLVSGGALGTPASGTLTSCTGLPISTGVSGLGTGIATALAVNTGSAGAPVLFNGALGTPTSGTVTNLTGTASINTNGAHNGTVGATTPSTGAFTTLSASSGATALAITANSTSANGTYVQINNSGTANTFLGAWRALLGAGNATDTVLLSSGATLGLGVNSGTNVPLSISSTGLAVTGALSSTGAISSTITGNDITPLSLLDSTLANSNFTQIVLGKATNSNECAVIKFTQNATTSVLGFQMFGDGSPGLTISKGASGIAAITSTGLAVTGDASATAQVVSGAVGATGSAWFRAGSTLAVKSGIDISDSSDTSSAIFAAWRNGSGSVIGSISRVTTTNAVAYNTTSDGRLKENLRDFTDSGRLIDSLKPRVFDWKNSDENGKNVVGFVAQEQHAADPIFAHIGAVSVGDEDSETITKQWQRSDSALIPILVAELKSVRARLAALESK